MRSAICTWRANHRKAKREGGPHRPPNTYIKLLHPKLCENRLPLPHNVRGKGQVVGERLTSLVLPLTARTIGGTVGLEGSRVLPSLTLSFDGDHRVILPTVDHNGPLCIQRERLSHIGVRCGETESPQSSDEWRQCATNAHLVRARDRGHGIRGEGSGRHTSIMDQNLDRSSKIDYFCTTITYILPGLRSAICTLHANQTRRKRKARLSPRHTFHTL